MKKRGRKRSSKYFPDTITNPEQLPDRVWFNKSGTGKWMLDYTDPITSKKRSMRICSAQASLNEIWQASDAAFQNNTLVVTFLSLSNDFQKSIKWGELSPLTRDDYIGCHKKIISSKIGGQLLGDIPTEKWSIGLVRKYRDHRGQQSRSRANKELAYIKRIFSWACEYEKTKLNPAKGVSKLTITPRQHYADDKDYLFLLGIAKNSNYWYMPYMMELAYLCRMRLSEVTDFTDSDALEKGLLIRRRKGSKDNIVAWSPRLRTLWDNAICKRTDILSNKKQPLISKDNLRHVFISEKTGDKLQVSSVKTAKNRIDHAATALAKEMEIEYTHFYFHDLKRKGVSDTSGNKLEASGHRSESMLKVYDVKPALVDEAGK